MAKIERINLNEKVKAEEAKKRVNILKRWELREAKKAKTVHVSFSFTNRNEVPFDLEEREWNPKQYAVNRTQEVFNNTDGVNPNSV